MVVAATKLPATTHPIITDTIVAITQPIMDMEAA
jgi:hypothetical protein